MPTVLADGKCICVRRTLGGRAALQTGTFSTRKTDACLLRARNQRDVQRERLGSAPHDDIQATALTALTQFGDEKSVAQDETLMKRIDQLGKGKSAKVKKPARQFLTKHGK